MREKSKDALEQVTGAPFAASVPDLQHRPQNALGHRRAGGMRLRVRFLDLPGASRSLWHFRCARGPFVVSGREQELLELPPLTYRALGFNLPVAGGGYFRLFPLPIMRAGIRQAMRSEQPAVAMLYFHPWEFDEDQPRLPLGRLARWRTYVGIGKTTNRLKSLLSDFTFTRAADAVEALRAP